VSNKIVRCIRLLPPASLARLAAALLALLTDANARDRMGGARQV